jgi:hypothetical protein
VLLVIMGAPWLKMTREWGEGEKRYSEKPTPRCACA